MRRRTVLAGLAGVFAGCNSVGTEASSSSVTTPAPVPSDAPVSTDRWRRFDEEICPRFDRRTDQTVCGHVQSAESALRLLPDRPVVHLADGDPVKPLRLTLRWTAEGALTVFANDWYVFERTADEWTNVATASPGGETVNLQHGDRHYWLLDTTTHDTAADVESVATSLSPGRHAFAVQTVSERSSVYTECLALFDVVAADGRGQTDV
ncbi:hypothetical protein EGH21_12455 [Halomicroarcula sp. F13]|uniref:Lipoprotein n=1 Tax=Haloarcula rubra TaxID=2487747 RepID=A0AAW4PU93_9EURY|nr:hypothetical protein [Halomicroarcula rubra]MBX0323842.1 hypothetical protein [Halomicroarcula rubra]